MADHQELSEDSGGESEPCPDSLWAWLVEEGSLNRGGPAVIAPSRQTKELIVAWTYGQLIDRVEQMAAQWTQSGIAPGDKVFAFLDDSAAADWTLLFWLAVRLGATFMVLEPAIFKRPEELIAMVDLLKPTVVVAQDADRAHCWDEMNFDVELKLQLLCNSSKQDEGSWKTLHTSETPTSWATISKVNPEDIAMVMNTSGSTSLPKCCPITVRTLVAEIRQYHSFSKAHFNSTTRHLMSLGISRPICYLGCFNTWRAGGAAVFTGGAFEVESTFRVVHEAKCTHAWFVPAMIHMLHDFKEEHTKLESLQTVLMSGDTADSKTIGKAKDMLPNACRFIPHWGMSEGAPLFGYIKDEEMSFDKNSGIAGTGRALQGTKVRVCQSGTRSPVRRGEQGELHVNSDACVDYYLGNRSEEEFYDDEVGKWFKTGDTAIMDTSGVIYIVGRTKDIIVYMGRNIIPTVMQKYLEGQFPAEWVVVGLKDEVYGGLPAAIVKELSVSKEEVVEYVQRAKIEHSAVAGGIYELRELGLEDWPHNSSNKIQKRDLVEAVEKVRAR